MQFDMHINVVFLQQIKFNTKDGIKPVFVQVLADSAQITHTYCVATKVEIMIKTNYGDQMDNSKFYNPSDDENYKKQ